MSQQKYYRYVDGRGQFAYMSVAGGQSQPLPAGAIEVSRDVFLASVAAVERKQSTAVRRAEEMHRTHEQAKQAEQAKALDEVIGRLNELGLPSDTLHVLLGRTPRPIVPNPGGEGEF